MTHARKKAGESGVTLIELLVVVVLIAIIIIPISNALLQGVTLPSIDANRSSEAAARSLMSLQFDNDVAAAQMVMLSDGTVGSKLSITCPSGSRASDGLVTLNWSDNTTTPPTPVAVVYKLAYPAFNALTTVQIVRTETKGANVDSRVMLTGYCQPTAQLVKAWVSSNTPNCSPTTTTTSPGSTCLTKYGAYEKRVRLKVSMQDGPNDGLNSYSFEAAQRDTCANLKTPGVACGVMSTLLQTGKSAASFKNPYMMALDKDDNIYVADYNSNVIREVAAKSGMQWGRSMTAGNIYTVAGTGAQCADPPGPTACGDGGSAVAATLNGPYAVSVGPDGSLFIGDSNDDAVRIVPKVEMSNNPWGYSGVMEANNIYTIVGQNRNLTGMGGCSNSPSATSVTLSVPKRVVFDSNGNLILSDASHNCVREVSRSGGAITTIAAGLGHPMGMVIDGNDDLYIADRDNNRILEVPLAAGPPVTQWGITMAQYKAYTVVGGAASCTLAPSVQCATDPAAQNGDTFRADDLAFDADGDLVISDTGNNAIQVLAAVTRGTTPWGVALTTGRISKIAGLSDTTIKTYTGNGYKAFDTSVSIPQSVAVDSKGNVLYTDGWSRVVRKISKASDRIFTVAGNGVAAFAGEDVPAATPEVFDVGHLSTDANGNVFIADTYDNRIRELRTSGDADGEVWTVAGMASVNCTPTLPPNPPPPPACFDGQLAIQTMLNRPTAVAVAGNGDMYIVDAGNERVRRVAASDSTVYPVANTTPMSFATPPPQSHPTKIAGDIAIDTNNGNPIVYIADTYDCVVWKLDAAGTVSQFAGTAGSCGNSGVPGPAAAAHLSSPGGIDVAPNGDVYIADTLNNRVLYVSGGNIYPFAGDATSSHLACSTAPCGDGSAATSALLNQPNDVAVTSSGVYIADTGDAVIRKVPIGDGVIVTVAGTFMNTTSGGDGGSATFASMAGPGALAFDSAGTLYISNCVVPGWGLTLGGPIRQVFTPE